MSAALDLVQRDVDARRRVAVHHGRHILPATFSQLQPASLLEHVSTDLLPALRWTPADGNLVLLGGSGSGKSALAAYLVRRELARIAYDLEVDEAELLRVRWVGARELGEAFRSRFTAREASDLIRFAQCASVLVLDDLGQDASREGVNLLMSQRYEGRGRPKATIITSGLHFEQIHDQYGEDIARRIVQSFGRSATMLEAW